MIYLSITLSESIFYDITQRIKQYFNNLNDKLDSNKPESKMIQYINIYGNMRCINWLYFKVYYWYYLVGMRFIYDKFTHCFVILYDAINIDKAMVVPGRCSRSCDVIIHCIIVMVFILIIHVNVTFKLILYWYLQFIVVMHGWIKFLFFHLLLYTI